MSKEEENTELSSNELAEIRTSLAHGRSLYAAERTFAAWIRTGFSISGAGVTLATALQNTTSRTISLVMGTILILAGIIMFAYALYEYRRSFNYIKEVYNVKDEEASTQNFKFNIASATFLSVVLIVVSLMGLIMVIF